MDPFIMALIFFTFNAITAIIGGNSNISIDDMIDEEMQQLKKEKEEADNIASRKNINLGIERHPLKN